ncbi:MAG: serine/threonine protein kinase [Clostridiales bacterium]|jgi:serine/threonine-protein kinase|nr:serine/threonine protein kinase [Clostridiales bacterium]
MTGSDNKRYIQHIDGVPFKLKSPFDFSFLSKYGRVFKVFDDQDSGNICFGVQSGGGKRYFVKFAGAPAEQYTGDIEGAVGRLAAAVPVYRDLAHPALIRLVDAEEIGGGFAIVFDWVDAVCMHRMYPLDCLKFKTISSEARLRIFGDILDFHAHVAAMGYVAVDFYEGSIMYDFAREKTVICDIDFYKNTKAYGSSFLWGHMDCMSPEERTDGVLIDEISNVYAMGATAFALFADGDRSREAWTLSDARYAVVKKAVSDTRGERQGSIRQLMAEWESATDSMKFSADIKERTRI